MLIHKIISAKFSGLGVWDTRPLFFTLKKRPSVDSAHYPMAAFSVLLDRNECGLTSHTNAEWLNIKALCCRNGFKRLRKSRCYGH